MPITVEQVIEKENNSEKGLSSLLKIRSLKDIPRRWIYIAAAGVVVVWVLSSQNKKPADVLPPGQAGSGKVEI